MHLGNGDVLQDRLRSAEGNHAGLHVQKAGDAPAPDERLGVESLDRRHDGEDLGIAEDRIAQARRRRAHPRERHGNDRTRQPASRQRDEDVHCVFVDEERTDGLLGGEQARRFEERLTASPRYDSDLHEEIDLPFFPYLHRAELSRVLRDQRRGADPLHVLLDRTALPVEADHDRVAHEAHLGDRLAQTDEAQEVLLIRFANAAGLPVEVLLASTAHFGLHRREIGSPRCHAVQQVEAPSAGEGFSVAVDRLFDEPGGKAHRTLAAVDFRAHCFEPIEDPRGGETHTGAGEHLQARLV